MVSKNLYNSSVLSGFAKALKNNSLNFNEGISGRDRIVSYSQISPLSISFITARACSISFFFMNSSRSLKIAIISSITSSIPTVVWLCPILPFINDTEENLRGILNYCVEAKVYGIINFGMGLTLREGNREYFYKQLDRLFPGLKGKYIAYYGNQYILPSPNENHLYKIKK